MREILFRGKRLANDKWKYGSYVFQYDCHLIYLTSTEGEYGFDNYHIDPETVGQYTGLKDKDGLKIFEGDILKTIFGVGYVVYGIGCFSVQYEPTNRPAIDIVMNDSDVFVIGNIHDNPELLKEGGE